MEKKKKRKNPNAKFSFWIGLLLWVPFFNYFTSFIAIFFGMKGLREIRAGKGSGKWLALMGIILGIIPYYLTVLRYSPELVARFVNWAYYLINVRYSPDLVAAVFLWAIAPLFWLGIFILKRKKLL